MNKIKLMTYVEDVMKEYDIPDTLKNKKRIRAMFEKRLKKEGLWDSAELVKSSNRRSNAKVFVIEELERIKLELHDYLKANNAGAIVKNVLEKDLDRKQTAVKLEMAKLRGEQPGNLLIERINKPLPAHQDPRWEISDRMRLDIMIEALFNAQFEDIDINNGVKTENLSDNIMLETILRKQRDDQYARKTRQNVQRVSDLIIELKVTVEENNRSCLW